MHPTTTGILILVAITPFVHGNPPLENTVNRVPPEIRSTTQPPAGIRPEARSFWSPLGLPRLRVEALPGDALPIGRDRFTVDPLDRPDSNAALHERDGIRVLALKKGASWSRPLQGKGRDSVYVSIGICASKKTVITIGGFHLSVADGPLTSHATIYRLEDNKSEAKWVPTGIHARMEEFDGKKMAALPTLTVRIDPVTRKADLYAGSRLVSAGLPARSFEHAQERVVTISNGESESWMTGLVMSRENPLFEDENGNAIDDSDEKAALGGRLLKADSSIADRNAVSEESAQSEKAQRPPAQLTERLKPDRLVTERAQVRAVISPKTK